jgi:hypothetical protein
VYIVYNYLLCLDEFKIKEYIFHEDDRVKSGQIKHIDKNGHNVKDNNGCVWVGGCVIA